MPATLRASSLDSGMVWVQCRKIRRRSSHAATQRRQHQSWLLAGEKLPAGRSKVDPISHFPMPSLTAGAYRAAEVLEAAGGACLLHSVCAPRSRHYVLRYRYYELMQYTLYNS